MSFDIKTTEYFKKNFEEILKLLPEVLQSQEESAIHQMRVHIKKLYALVKLLEKSEPNSKIKSDFKPIRRLFKKAGAIREIQLDLSKLEKVAGDVALKFPELHQKLEKMKLKISQNGEVWETMVHRVSELFNQYEFKLPTRLLQDYFNSSLTAANNFMQQKEFHEARKKIKSVLYLKDLLPEIDQNSLGIDFSFLDDLQEKIGNWNDLHLSALRKEGDKENLNLESDFQQLNEELKNKAKDFMDSVYQKDKSQ